MKPNLDIIGKSIHGNRSMVYTMREISTICVSTKWCGLRIVVPQTVGLRSVFLLFNWWDPFFLDDSEDSKNVTISCSSGGSPFDAMEYYQTHGLVTGGDPTIKDQSPGCLPYNKIKVEKQCETQCDNNSPFDRKYGNFTTNSNWHKNQKKF